MGHPASVAMEYARRCTVQLTSKRIAGTGFFVEHNIILTCAHVVNAKRDPVQIRWQGRTLTGTVLDRLPDLRRSSGKVYPFPDLAFIGLDEAIDHPVADIQTLMFKRNENKDLRLTALAFNREAPNPQGGPDPVTLDVEGPSDEWVKAVPESGVIPGMSGAPIVDQSTGRVCGILKYSVKSQNAVWFIDAEDIERYVDRYRKVLNAYEPLQVKLFRPEEGEPLYDMLLAQQAAAEELPYQVVKGEVPLSTVYVEQRAESWRAQKEQETRRGVAVPAEPSVIEAEEMVQRHRNALVVSGPGGGKSTLLQHLVAESADWWLRPGQPERGEVPAFGPAVAVRCAATRLLANRAWYECIAEAVNAELGGHLSMPVRPEMFMKPPRPSVDWLVLVDGLDEIIQADRRLRLIRILAQHIARYGGQARFVVASRALAEAEFYGLRAQVAKVDRTRRLGEYNLRPFDRAAVEKFAGRWYALRDPDRAAERTAGFLQEVDDRRLMPLVSIPLLCTIAADVYQHNPQGELPSGRTTLYKKFVDGLLFGRRADTSAWNRIRRELADIDDQSEEFGKTFFNKRLACLTYLAKQRVSHDVQPSVELTREWLVAQGIEPPPGITDDHIREVLLTTGLVVNRGDSMQFTHLSIAEYLSTGGDTTVFNWEAWLRSVSVAGVTSARMFELGRWTDEGNDPMVVVQGLAQPGAEHDYPGLAQLADVVADGAAATAEATAVTIEVVQNVHVRSDEGIRALNSAARAVVLRAPDPSPLIRMIQDPSTPELKRIEIASVVLAEGDVEGRRKAAGVLNHLGYSGAREAERRMPALRALAEAGTPDQRRYALLHLRSIAESAADPEIRASAALDLVTLGEPGEVLVALSRRVARQEADHVSELADVDPLNFLMTQVDQWVERLGAEPDPEPYRSVSQVRQQPWSLPSPPGTLRHPVWWLTGILSGHVPHEAVTTAITTLVRDRRTPWAFRLISASSLDRPELKHFALEQLISDTSVAPTMRVTTVYVLTRHHNRATATAMLREIAGDERAPTAARLCAFNLLGSDGEGGRRWLATAARDGRLPVILRIEAAAALGRGPDRAVGLDLLAGLGSERELGLPRRWQARIVWLVTQIQPATTWLTAGTAVTDLIRRVFWGPIDRVLDKLRNWDRSPT